MPGQPGHATSFVSSPSRIYAARGVHDTTYASPRWDFPPQPESLSMMQRIVQAELAREPRTLFIVGSYSVIFDSPPPFTRACTRTFTPQQAPNGHVHSSTLDPPR